MLARTPRNGHPKMLPAQSGINAPRIVRIDINALDETDPVHFQQPRKLTADQADENLFSIENGDGEIY
jgi:hypothetical protein